MSRAKGRAGVWIYTALLAGALTQAVADKAMAQRPGNTSGTPSTKVDGPAGKLATDKTSAKSKLLRARTELAQGNIDGAEALAREVAGMSLTWSSSEDSPQQVLVVIGKAKTQPRTLLQASRYALTRKDYTSAEKYARMAEDNSSLVSFTPWGDSPRKVMDEIRKAKGTTNSTGVASKKGTPADKMAKPVANGMKVPYVESPAMPPAVSTKNAEPVGAAKDKPAVARQTTDGPTMPSALAKKGPEAVEATKDKTPVVGRNMMPAKAATAAVSETEEARQLVQKARKAMAEKKYDEARTSIASARAKKANLSWWEDNPEKVEMDLKKLESSTGTNVASAKTMNMPNAKKPAPSEIVPVSATVVKAGEDKMKATQPTTVPRTKDEARAQLVQGRKMLAEGKIEDAARISQKVKSQATISWGLFEDSPDRLSLDIEKARARRDREESARLVVEGRKLYEKGDLEGATRLAYRAQKMHGTYSIWDLGDRPSKLLMDIQTAQARSRKTALPPTAVARKDDKPASTDSANAKAMPKKADTLVAKSGDSQDPLPPVPGVGTGAKTTPPSVNTPATPVVSGDRLRAQQLVAEAQRLHREGKLLEARMKTVEAQKLNVRFGPEETSPEFVYQQLAIEAKQRVDQTLRAAQDGLAQGKGEVKEKIKSAEKALEEAKALAMGFGHDVKPIEVRVGEIQVLKVRVQSGGNSGLALVSHQAPGEESPTPLPLPKQLPTQLPTPTPNPMPAPTTVAAAKDPAGIKMLENARTELRKGETGTARRLAETALTQHKDVHDEAMSLLRTIDVEEFNQKQMGATRAFDAAMAAYRRKEFARASAMMAAIDIRLLDADRQNRLREINLTTEMAPGVAKVTDVAKPGKATEGGAEKTPVTEVKSPAAEGGSKTVAKNEAGSAASDTDGGLIEKHRQMQRVVFEKLRQEGMEVQREAAEKFRTGQNEAAMEQLQDYLARLGEEKLETAQVNLLRRPIESRLSHFRLLKAQKEMAAGAVASKQANTDKIAASRRAEEMKQKNVEKLMKDFNTNFKEGKYLEAESLAMRALELDPDNGVASAAVYMARRQRDVTAFKKIKDGREKMNLTALNDAENEPGSEAVERGVAYDQERWNQASKRKASEPIKLGRPSEKEKVIERQLSTPISISFDSTPLKQVLDELRDVHGINIVPDLPAMQEAGVSPESPISIKVDRVSLKSALNLILHQVRLTHVVKDEVLMITTEENAKGKLTTVTYPVADLVIPVENFGDVRNPNSLSTQAPSGVQNYTPTPVTGPQSMVSGTPVGTPLGDSMLRQTSPNSMSASPTTAGMSNNGNTTTKRGPNNTTEEQLIKLITSTIAPRTWSEMGGPATVDYFPLTMSLIINQTPDIQEQIQELLTALRRLQDQEVAVEVRFISVSEDFFERIGVNFNMNVQTHNQRFEPMLQQNAFVWDNSQFINAFRPGRFLAGMTPAGTLTPTLDIPINNNSFFATVPNFGGYAPTGLTMGLAFLSDIQVFLFLEAAQGDQRANVMQAPKLTLFNGQTATLNVFDMQSFVTGVQVAQLAGGQFAMVPNNVPMPFGVQLTIQAVISADRRFVRLSLAPFMTNLLPGPVQTFPIVVPIFTSLEGNGAGQPVVFTQFIQQPTTTQVSVQTTVAVPDGGTVLMGGLKRLAEARSEYGPPILSKVPYINRLFKNVGYGRETDSMLIMVTPRIIVQAEEEERQTGFISGGKNP